MSGVAVTIMSGLRSGANVVTDERGYYFFSEVAGDELHLRVEKECFEPKEVIVHRHLPTTLPNKVATNFRGRDPQKNPGVILIGQSWPEGIQEVLRQTTVIPDLLFVRIAIEDRWTQGFYGDGVVAMDYNDPWIFNAVIHEIGHAHQHAVVSIDGSGETREWENTPEGRAFAEARRKDWEEVGKIYYYKVQHHFSLLENAAETFAH